MNWTNSTTKHGFSHKEAQFAIENAHHVVHNFDEPRSVGHVSPTLFIGPSRLGGPLLEVLVEIVPPDDVTAFHVMEARPKHLALMEGRSNDQH